ARVGSVVVERAASAEGPWTRPTLETSEEVGTTVALDRTAEAGREFFYRLAVTLSDGSSTIFGPVSSAAAARVTESGITRLAPNPSAGRTQIQYAVARAGRVRLTVVDIAGRVVSTLVDGPSRSGRFSAIWDGATSSG